MSSEENIFIEWEFWSPHFCINVVISAAWVQDFGKPDVGNRDPRFSRMGKIHPSSLLRVCPLECSAVSGGEF